MTREWPDWKEWWALYRTPSTACSCHLLSPSQLRLRESLDTESLDTWVQFSLLHLLSTCVRVAPSIQIVLSSCSSWEALVVGKQNLQSRSHITFMMKTRHLVFSIHSRRLKRLGHSCKSTCLSISIVTQCQTWLVCSHISEFPNILTLIIITCDGMVCCSGHHHCSLGPYCSIFVSPW